MNPIVSLDEERAQREDTRPRLIVPPRGGVLGIGMAIAGTVGLAMWGLIIWGVVAIANALS